MKTVLLLLALVTSALAADPVVKEISPGVLEVGGVRVETKAGRLSFPAVVNMHEGVIEYALVHRDGKVHESILATDIQPQSLHVAALLLGWRTAAERGPSRPAAVEPGAARENFPATVAAAAAADGDRPRSATNPPPALHGEVVRLRVVFADGTNHVARTLEELVRNVETDRPLAPGPWIYNGSEIFGGKFVAQTEGSIVAIMDDAAALVNNPRPDRENDKIWRVNDRLVPARGTKATVIFERERAERIEK